MKNSIVLCRIRHHNKLFQFLKLGKSRVPQKSFLTLTTDLNYPFSGAEFATQQAEKTAGQTGRPQTSTDS